MKLITLIIPAKNEILSLGKVLIELSKYSSISEIIIVVDNPDDTSISIAKKFNCKIIVQKNSGYGSAIIEGFKIANTEYACIFNADFSFDPIYLQNMILLTEKYDFIFGSRYGKNGKSDDDDLITLFGNTVFSFMSKMLLKIRLSDILYTYVLCNVLKFNKINFKNRDFRFCIELPFQIEVKKLTYTEISMVERKRFAGKKNVNIIKDGFLILTEIINSFFRK